MELTVVEGDITQQQVDAIVNAANSRLHPGAGVSGAIHAAGGPAIRQDCVRLFPDGIPTGGAGATTAGELYPPVMWVIHVVGPVHGDGTRDELVSCYANALHVADDVGARTVAFPLISAGIYGWPLDDAVRVAVDTLRSTPTSVREARLVAFGRSTYDAIVAAL